MTTSHFIRRSPENLFRCTSVKISAGLSHPGWMNASGFNSTKAALQNMHKTIALTLISLFLQLITQAQSVPPDTSRLANLDPVTIIGEKGRLRIGSGHFIDSRTIALLNQPNINHVLRQVPGVNIRDEEGFGLRPNIGLRGTAVNRSAKITLMEDGILMAPAPYADPSAYYFPTFARMNSVEVLKGSSQIKFGPYTIGGALNLLSTPIPGSFRGFAQLSFGSFGNNQQRLWVGDSRKNFDYVMEVNRLASKGFKQLDGGGNTGFDRRDFMGKFRWHSNEKALIPQSLTLKLVQTTELGNESYLGLTYNDFKINPLRRYAATQSDVLNMNHQSASLSHLIAPKKGLSISTKAYFTGTFRDWSRVNTIGGKSLNSILADPSANEIAYRIMTGTSDGNMDYQIAARTYFSKGLETNIQYAVNTGAVAHKAQIGLRYHSDQADRYGTKSSYSMTNGLMILTAAGVKGNQENQIRKAKSMAAFFRYEFSFKGLNITPGLRYEDIHFEFLNYGTADNARTGLALQKAKNHLSILLPGVGLNYKVNRFLEFYGGVHEGFSPPGMPSFTTGNTQARSETAINYELGYRYEKRTFTMELTGFSSAYDNILGSDNVSGGGAGTGAMFNAGNALIQGLELSAGYSLLSGSNSRPAWRIPILLAYTYTNARFKDSFQNAGGDWGSGMIYEGDFIPFIPLHSLSLSIGLEHRKLYANLSARYVGNNRTKPGQDALITPDKANAYNEVNSIAGFLMIDFSANYRLSRAFSFFATLNNLTNNRNIVANLPNGYRPNMPLSFVLGMKADIR